MLAEIWYREFMRESKLVGLVFLILNLCAPLAGASPSIPSLPDRTPLLEKVFSPPTTRAARIVGHEQIGTCRQLIVGQVLAGRLSLEQVREALELEISKRKLSPDEVQFLQSVVILRLIILFQEGDFNSLVPAKDLLTTLHGYDTHEGLGYVTFVNFWLDMAPLWDFRADDRFNPFCSPTPEEFAAAELKDKSMLKDGRTASQQVWMFDRILRGFDEEDIRNASRYPRNISHSQYEELSLVRPVLMRIREKLLSDVTLAIIRPKNLLELLDLLQFSDVHQ